MTTRLIVRRSLPCRVAAGLLVLGIASVGLLARPATASAASLPFTDTSQNGYIGFCDGNDKPITSGDVDSTPFVWKAVSSVTPPTAFQGTGQNAVLEVYQVRKDVDPVDFASDQLTAPSYYKNAKQPTAQATTEDDSLASFMKAYPPDSDGLYQLRMIFGKTNYGIYSDKYPTAVIKVKDGKWTEVQGGQVDCSTATATSLEILTGVVPAAAASPNGPHSVAAATSAPSGAASAPGSVDSGTALMPLTSNGNTPALKDASADKSSSSSLPIEIAVVVGAIALAAGGIVFWHRRAAPRGN